jgi:hypothetical protein
MNRSEAEAYVKKLRNLQKKAYAEAWIKYAFDGGPEPMVHGYNLTFMGAQAVRLTIGQPHEVQK